LCNSLGWGGRLRVGRAVCWSWVLVGVGRGGVVLGYCFLGELSFGVELGGMVYLL